MMSIVLMRLYDVYRIFFLPLSLSLSLNTIRIEINISHI